MNNQLPPIWVISLQRSTERRVYITQHLRDLNLPFEFIDAIDGQTLTPEQLRLYSSAQTQYLLNRELTAGEIGCALSHLMALRRIVDQKIPEALILEDDVVLTPDFLDVLGHRSNFPKDWELVLFGYTWGIPSYWGRQPLGRERFAIKFGRRVSGNFAYLVTQHGAQKVLAAAYPIRMPSDALTGGLIRTGLHLYGIWPECAATLHAHDLTYSTMPETASYRNRNQAKFEQLSRRGVARLRIKNWIRRMYYRYNPLTIV